MICRRSPTGGLNQYADINGIAPVHDGNGNITTDHRGRTYIYDAENVLRAANENGGAALGAYAYYADGARKSKTAGGATSTFYYTGDQEIAEYAGATLTRRYVRLPGSVDEPILMIDYTLVAVSDSTGAVIEKYTYSAYGESGNEGDAGFPFRFTGQKLDAETGLYYYKARYYDPETGRFLQTDPIGYRDQMNLYGYVGNDPVNSYDPTGLYCNTLNRGSGFCSRSQRFATIDADSRVNSRTTLFAAASLTTEVLGSLDGPFGNKLSGKGVANYLRQASAGFEKRTSAIADAIRNDGFLSRGSVAENDALLVRFEQAMVQLSLDSLKASDEALYNRVIDRTNNSLNGGRGSGLDENYAKVLDQVREDLGGKIDFSNKDHRIAIGNALTAAIRSSRKVTCTGSRIKRTSC